MAKTRQNASSQDSNSDNAMRKMSLRQVQGQPLRRSGRVSKPFKNVDKRGAPAQKSGRSIAKLSDAVKSPPKTPTSAEATKKTNQNEGWISPDYNDVDWLRREAHRCQVCDKIFDSPAGASLCITSHRDIRCYFCFTIYKSTDDLFEHFDKCHKQATKDKNLICPFCDKAKAIPYKSVSVHVISTHLKQLAVAATPVPNNQDDDWVMPDYNDVEWLYREAHRCQSCSKTFENAPQASLCITSHKVNRCYFCFRIYKTTDDLFQHFEKCHRQADSKENTLTCPFCEGKFRYQSAACHVISEHLRDFAVGRTISKSKLGTRRAGRRGRNTN